MLAVCCKGQFEEAIHLTERCENTRKSFLIVRTSSASASASIRACCTPRTLLSGTKSSTGRSGTTPLTTNQAECEKIVPSC